MNPSSWLSTWSLTPKRRQRQSLSRGVQAVESRVLLAQRVWSGGAALNDRWSDKDNWVGRVAPVAGDDLVFPAGIGLLDRGMVNDIASSKFRNILFESGDYKVTGNTITLSGNITTLASTDATEIDSNIVFTAAGHQLNVQGPLVLNGRLSNLNGSGEVRKTNVGTLSFGGIVSNTLRLPVVVAEGELTFDKENSAAALAGNLTVGVGTGTGAKVTLNQDNAFSNAPLITIGSSLNQFGRLDLGAFHNLRVSGLRMKGGIVEGTGTLQLSGDVTVEFQAGVGGGRIISNLALGSSQRKFTVIGANTLLDIRSPIKELSTFGPVGQGIVKAGNGTLELKPEGGANTYKGRTSIVEGTLRIPQQATPGVTIIPGDLTISSSSVLEAQAADVFADTSNVRVIGQGIYHQQTATETIGSLNVLENAKLLVSAAGQFRVLGTSTFSGLARLEAIDNAVVTFSGDTRLLGGTLSLTENASATQQGDLVLRGGRVEANAISPLSLQRGITVESAPQLSSIAGKIRFAAAPFAGFGHRIEVADGPGAVDLQIDAAIEQGTSTLKLFKAGLGAVVVQGNVNASNLIELAAGRMIINGTLSQANVTVTQGILGGIGQFRNINLTGGTLAPGLSPGLINATRIDLGPASRYQVELNGVTPGVTHDQISSGDLGLSNLTAGFPTLEVLVNFNTSLGQEFEIANINNDSGTTGRFKDLNGVILEQGSIFAAGGKNFQISYAGGDGNDITIKRVSGNPAFENRSLTPIVNEGGFATLSGLITEPDAEDTFFLDVDWGDGMIETFTFLPGTPRQVAVTHQYMENVLTPIPVHVVWHDEHGGGNSAVLQTQVRNVAPVITGAAFDAPPVAGTPSTLRFRIFDPSPLDTLQVEVQWGDGTPTEIVELPAGTTDVALLHQFTKKSRRVRLRVADDDGGSGTATVTIA